MKRSWLKRAACLIASIFVAGFVLGGITHPAVAGETFFTSQTAYDTALSVAGISSKSFNFNSTPFDNYSTAAGLTIDGVNFVGNTGSPGYYSLNLTPAYFCCDDYNNPNVSLQAPAVSSGFYSIPDGSTAITIAGGTKAFSLTAYTVQAGDYGGDGQDTLNLTVGGQTGQTFTYPDATTGFIGVISTSTVTGAILTGSTPEDFIDITNGSVGSGSSVSAVPEPSTWLLMIAGIGGIGLMLRRPKQTMGFRSKDAFSA